MKIATRILGVLALVFIFCACGGSNIAQDERLFTGEIVEDGTSAVVVKASESAGGCVGEVCGVAAIGPNGEQVAGEIDPNTHRWRVRVRHGNWMFGFEDGAGQRLGYLAMNGITTLTIEDGEDVDLGQMQLRDGLMIMLQDKEGLGENGVYSYYGADINRNGIFAGFENDPAYDESQFNVLFVRPYDGQKHVAPCRPVKIVFNMAIDDVTVSSDTVIVENDIGESVEGTLAIWEDAEYGEYEIKFLPTGGYEMGSVIFVTVVSGAEGVLSEDGDMLAADVSTSFEVRDFGGTSLICHDPDQEHQQLRIQENERERERTGQ
jgi:hypothetical protein